MCFWIVESVFGIWDVFWILGSVFGFWKVFLSEMTFHSHVNKLFNLIFTEFSFWFHFESECFWNSELGY